MSRVESSSPISSKQSRGLFKKILKGIFFIFIIPFKISFRLIILAFLVVLFVIVVRTGVWEIPVATNILYREPEPAHQVQKAYFSQTLFKLQTEQKFHLSASRTVDISLTEPELNALFQESFASKDAFPLESSQVAMKDGALELYGKLRSRPRAVVRVYAVPEAKDGNIHFRLTHVYVGQVGVPQWLIPGAVLDAFTPPMLSGILDIAPIQHASIQGAELHLTLSVL